MHIDILVLSLFHSMPKYEKRNTFGFKCDKNYYCIKKNNLKILFYYVEVFTLNCFLLASFIATCKNNNYFVYV